MATRKQKTACFRFLDLPAGKRSQITTNCAVKRADPESPRNAQSRLPFRN
jgi:hypothetical protein